MAWPTAVCKAVLHYFTMRMQRKQEPAAESGTHELSRQPFTDPDDRPILNGISTDTAHSHTD